jgi:hypothetical protein
VHPAQRTIGVAFTSLEVALAGTFAPGVRRAMPKKADRREFLVGTSVGLVGGTPISAAIF